MISIAFGLMATGAFIYGFFFTAGTDPGMYWNSLGALIVFGGTAAAVLLSNKFSDLLEVFRIIWATFTTKQNHSKRYAKLVIGLAKSAKIAAEDRSLAAKHPVLALGIRLVESKVGSERVLASLTNAVRERSARQMAVAETLRGMARFPPAFGMVGTVYGLVGLLSGLAIDTDGATIGKNMAVALLTTLYGLLISNNVIHPLADQISSHVRKDAQTSRMLANGLVLVAMGEDPVFVEESMAAFDPQLATNGVAVAPEGAIGERRAA